MENTDPIQPTNNINNNNNFSPNKKFCRSNSDYILFGVCGGFAEFNLIDPMWIRLLLALSILLNPLLIALYFVAAILTPRSMDIVSAVIIEQNQKANKLFFVGLIFLFVGLYCFFNSSAQDGKPILLILNDELAFSILIFLVGFYNLLFSEEPKIAGTEKVFYRCFNRKKFFGVCSGFAEYFNVDLSLVRFIFILLSFMTAGIFILIYFYIAMKTEGKHEIIF